MKDEATDVAVKPQAGLPAGINLEADAGQGMQNATSDDMVIPFVRVAQALSPEINKRQPEYIAGLELGDLFNTGTRQFWKGDSGVCFIPALFKRSYLEFALRENGGGFFGEHGPEIIERTTRAEGSMSDILDNGHEIVTAGTWYGMLYDKEKGLPVGPAVLSLSKSQYKVSRQLMTMLKGFMLQGANGPYNPALFYHLLRLKSVESGNDQGTWQSFSITLEGSVLDLPDGASLYTQAKEMANAVARGQRRMDTPPHADEDIPF